MLSSLQMIPRTLRATPAIARAAPAMRMQAARMPATLPSFARGYASGGGLTQEQIQQRITDVIKSFEKVDPSTITPTASFTGDLGLDSLDSVEVVMAIEEEFNIEIPDAEADNITTVNQAVDYIAHTPDAI
ncbi:mitochondrial acyl carrier protein [Malassezia japonica]|uniref:Acyl carrier protein n=1 Tax=Malassezia japonica TaxID=223818 RepID=A0AAF0EVR6_9BASI|nr:mitochondrial acyl carrier protein [Malassezia japonica]WFD37795.1 mitochondrial acyl carrier protein [Malassezia japonica]